VDTVTREDIADLADPVITADPAAKAVDRVKVVLVDPAILGTKERAEVHPVKGVNPAKGADPAKEAAPKAADLAKGAGPEEAGPEKRVDPRTNVD
jgi:hypothetical protein